MMQHDLELALLKTFIAIVDTGRLTKAGARIRRTQPAVSHQLRRLESIVGRPLFKPDRRHLVLTTEGEILLQYARAMIELNDKARARFSSPELVGKVTIGTPDLYAAYLLPDILQAFIRSHPKVQVELRCGRSRDLRNAFAAGDIDLALVTRQPDMIGDHVIHREPLIWVSGAGSAAENEAILPLALYPEGSVYREIALDALSGTHRPWRVVTVSDSIAGLQAAIFAGLAIALMPRCALIAGMRPLDRNDGLPGLPSVELVLLRQSDPAGAATRLADFVLEKLETAGPVNGG